MLLIFNWAILTLLIVFILWSKFILDLNLEKVHIIPLKYCWSPDNTHKLFLGSVYTIIKYISWSNFYPYLSFLFIHAQMKSWVKFCRMIVGIITYYRKICQEFFIIILIGYDIWLLTLMIQNYRKNNDEKFIIYFLDMQCDAHYKPKKS